MLRGTDANCAVGLASGTSAIGRERTRGGTFCRLGALGEIGPVVEDGLDGLSRREVAGLDDAGADLRVAGALSVRLPGSGVEPVCGLTSPYWSQAMETLSGS
jgi:hypothetical protein